MPVGMHCCIKFQENLLVVSEQGRIFDMLHANPNFELEYHFHYTAQKNGFSIKNLFS